MKSILTSKVFWVAVTQGIIGIMVAVDSVYPGIGWYRDWETDRKSVV